MNRKPGEQAVRLSRRQRDLLALDLDLQRSKQPNQHGRESNPASARAPLFDARLTEGLTTALRTPARIDETNQRAAAAVQKRETEMATTGTRQETEHKGFRQPDETREFPNGRAEILQIGDGEVGRFVFEPGWRWSNDVKPIAGTHSCEAPHFQYHLSGQLAIRMDDGTEFVAGPGEITSLPSGHDAWVVGDEPAVVIDWYGASNYAKHN
jgi:hypothetical protein